MRFCLAINENPLPISNKKFSTNYESRNRINEEKIRKGKGCNCINGKEVRARDVQILFADLSTGAHSPSMVIA